MRRNRYYTISAIAIFISFIMASCVNTKKAVYFNNIQDTTLQSAYVDVEPVIQKNDLLSISVSSLNPEASVIFNMPNATTGAAGTTSGYLINSEGFIQFPIIGNIKAAGLTKSALATNITQELLNKKLLKDPIVNIRYINFRVTVLGEVAQPSVINVPSEKITLLEALGMAGDLTVFAKRNNILLIREENGTKIIKRLNLNSDTIFTSPYYYLQSNDVVYAEPGKAKVSSASQGRQVLPIILSSLSVLAVVFRVFQ